MATAVQAPYGYVSSRNAYRGPDPIKVAEQLETLQNLAKLGAPQFSAQMFWINRKKTKGVQDDDNVVPIDGKGRKIWNRRLVPFVHNAMQLDLDRNMGRRNIILKYRQAGCTTYGIIERLLKPAILEPGTNCLLISQDNSYAVQHFGILQRAFNYFGVVDPFDNAKNEFAYELKKNLLHIRYTNRKEIVFDQLDSRVLVASAEVPEVGQGLCVHPMTWITTADNRCIRYKDLRIGDWVVGSDGRPTQVKRKYVIPAESHPWKGEARKIWLWGVSSLPMTVAPNHPFLTKYGMVEAKDLTTEDYLLYPRKKISGKKKFVDFSLYGSGVWAPKKAFNPGKVQLDRDFGMLCGLYLADGSWTERFIGITMVASRKKQYAFKRLSSIVAMVTASGLKERRNGRSVAACSKVLCNFVKAELGTAKTKHVPDWWQDAPRDFLIGLLEGWLVGDGYWPKKGNFLEGYGKSSSVVLGMREIVIALGLGNPYLKVIAKRNSKTTVCGVSCSSLGRRYVLAFRGDAYDELAQLLGLRRRNSKRPRRQSQYVDANYVYVKIQKISKTRVKVFHDITVTAKDHLYCLPYAVTHNTLQHVWCTEVARWNGNPEETLANLKEAIPDDGTIDLDSTANGWGGYFFEECMRSREWAKVIVDGREKEEADKEAEFKYHFFYWFMHEEYRKKPAADPDSITAEEAKLMKAFPGKIDLEQIAWRRMKKVSLRHEFAEKYAEDDLSCFLTSGQQFFDAEILKERSLELMSYKPLEKFKKIEIYKKRIKGRRYIIGADVATGLPVKSNDADYSYASVIDLETGEQCAAYRARIPEEEYAQDLAELGRLYNNALIGVERLGYGGTTIVTLEVACQYMNIFKYKDWWRRDNQRKLMEFPGVPMNTRTRPIALNRVRYFVRTSPELVYDRRFLDECMTFINDDKGKPCAQEGCHDDAVMANAIAQYIRSIQLGWLDPASVPSEKYRQTPGEFAGEEGGESEEIEEESV